MNLSMELADNLQKWEKRSADKAATTDVIVDWNNIYVQGSTSSIVSTIKTKAVNLRANYHSLKVNKAIVS